MNAIQISPPNEPIEVCELANEHCLLKIGEQRLVLNFESAYELAMKLAAHLSNLDK